jgi:hypothetical protein
MRKIELRSWMVLLPLALLLPIAFNNCSGFLSQGAVSSSDARLFSLSAGAKAPTLADYFEGRAHFESAVESEVITVRDPFSQITAAHHASRLPTFFDSRTGKYFGFTRVLRPKPGKEEHYDVVLLRSDDDGKSFEVVSSITNAKPTQDFLDPHLAIDTSVDPPRYVITMECGDPSVSAFADSCTMHSTNPTDPASWSIPKRIKIGCGAKAEGSCSGKEAISASTGLMMFDGPKKYFAWTSLELLTSNWHAETNRTYTSYMEVPDVDSPAGYANQPAIMFDAERNTHCKSAWDCNNRNLQDWVREGSYYYALYNGANYFGCSRPPKDPDTNEWGIAISRSTSPLGNYPSAAKPILKAERTNLCGISYGSFNRIKNDFYIYFAYFDQTGVSAIRRSRLVWNDPNSPEAKESPSPSPTPVATPTPAPVSLTPQQKFFKTMFTAILAREPDPAGLGSANAMSCHEIGRVISLSPEAFDRRYKSFSDAEFVRFVYATVFGRPVDDGGHATWTSALGAGTYTRETMIRYFLEHEEYKGRCARAGL